MADPITQARYDQYFLSFRKTPSHPNARLCEKPGGRRRLLLFLASLRVVVAFRRSLQVTFGAKFIVESLFDDVNAVLSQVRRAEFHEWPDSSRKTPRHTTGFTALHLI